MSTERDISQILDELKTQRKQIENMRDDLKNIYRLLDRFYDLYSYRSSDMISLQKKQR